MAWLFTQDSLVDFLAFCFALNTMFSFSKIRRRFLLKFQGKLRKNLEKINLLEEDCKAMFADFPMDKKDRICRCLDLQKCSTEVEDTISYNRKFLDKASFVFQLCFAFFAFFSAVILLFSGAPLWKTYYYFTVLLLLPIVLFFAFWGIYWFVMLRKGSKLREMIDKQEVNLQKEKKLMQELLGSSQKDNPDKN